MPKCLPHYSLAAVEAAHVDGGQRVGAGLVVGTRENGRVLVTAQ